MLNFKNQIPGVKLIGVLFILFVIFSGHSCSEPPPPETIFYNGPIITMASEKASGKSGREGSAPNGMAGPEAILVREGKIAQLGTKSEIMALKTESTRMVDLKGATLLPGFISPHTHPELSAYVHTFVDLSGFTNRTPEEVWNRLRAAVKKTKPGQWIYCKGFDPILVPGLKAPHISKLDEIAPHNPLAIISQSFHSLWANTLAFRELGIDAQTPDPAPGSYYEKDKDGKITGFVAEVAAIKPFTQSALPLIDIKKNFQGVMRGYARNGITGIGTAGLFGSDKKPLWMIRWLSSKTPGIFLRTLGFFGLLPGREPTVRNFVYLKADTPYMIPEKVERDEDYFQMIGIKIWYDGSPYTGSMYLSEPYLDSTLMREGLGVAPGSRGKSVMTREEFRRQIRKFHDLGFQLAIHTQGDQAAREILAEMKAMLKASPRKDHRHRLEHGLLIPSDLMSEIKRLGISPSFHINHLYFYGEALRDQIIGARRAETMLPLNSAGKNGVRYTLHADQPMYPENPLSLIATAVTRRTRNGSSLGAGEAVTVMAALRAMTVDAAWQLGMEKKLGTLEVGKYADLAVLDKNPLSVSPDKIREIRVLRTYVAGAAIYPNE